MTLLIDFFSSSIIFWMAWVIIPVVMEIIPAIMDFVVLLKRKVRKKEYKEITYMPEISLIIPVYNSAESLERCIESVYRSEYDLEKIYVMLVDNGSKDNSYEIFCRCREKFAELSMVWETSAQGKSKALNKALYNSSGKYIIHIDSDGMLHPQALKNMVTLFENELDIHCVTGTVITNPEMIDDTKGFFKRQFRKAEFFEYCQAFLAGRNFQSEFNSIFTLSGAFSAFRKSSILKTQLYNTETVCEDTHVTFQIRENLKNRIVICDNAFFFVDPIESLDQLYIQRQRWQRGEMEVIHMFYKDMKAVKGFISNFVIRIIIFDHTFAFPRMIWYFALICLTMFNYPVRLVVMSLGIIYALYMVSSFLFYISISMFLSKYKDLKKYYMRKWYHILFHPLFNFMTFWFRFAGIINSIRGDQSWKTRTFKEEYQVFRKIVKKDFGWFFRGLERLRKAVNVSEE